MKQGILSVGAGNFRKFSEFTQISLNQLTLLTGSNGSGKSSISKALQLLLENLKYQDTSSVCGMKMKMPFSFDSSKFEEINIGTFSRAISKEDEENNAIVFYSQFVVPENETRRPDAISFLVNVKKGPNLIDGQVSSISIESLQRQVIISIDFEASQITAQVDLYQSKIYDNEINAEDEMDNIIFGFDSYGRRLEDSDCFPESQRKNQYDEKYLAQSVVKDILNGNQNKEFKFSFSLTGSEIFCINQDVHSIYKDRPFIAGIIYSLANHYLDDGDFSDSKLSEEEIKLVRSKKEVFEEVSRVVQSAITDNDIIYDHAHTSSHNSLFSVKDKNDYVAKTMHELYKLGLGTSEIDPEDNHSWITKFILKWMDKDHFAIGSGYEVININDGGEFYAVKIQNLDGKTLNLCDFGSGTIQLLTLLFRIATYLKKYSNDRRNVVVIVEEPEQNLHPKMQSKLADFFYDIFSNDEFQRRSQVIANFNLIVETHSEYLIRRSQIIVGDNFGSDETISDNPFKVNYFPKEGQPYDLVYTKSGMFENKFGPGFLDEAGKLHLSVIKRSRE